MSASVADALRSLYLTCMFYCAQMKHAARANVPVAFMRVNHVGTRIWRLLTFLLGVSPYLTNIHLWPDVAFSLFSYIVSPFVIVISTLQHVSVIVNIPALTISTCSGKRGTVSSVSIVTKTLLLFLSSTANNLIVLQTSLAQIFSLSIATG